MTTVAIAISNYCCNVWLYQDYEFRIHAVAIVAYLATAKNYNCTLFIAETNATYLIKGYTAGI